MPSRLLLLLLIALHAPGRSAASGSPDAKSLIRSAKSGPWSDPATWEGGKVPGERSRVQVRTGHTVLYDSNAATLIRSIHVAGTLEFARDRSTRLDVGLIKIQAGDDASEDGFECDLHVADVDPRLPRPAFIVGTPESPIPAKHTALIRLTYIDGMNKDTLPALVCCAGRMDLHGAPLSRTWLKLGATAGEGQEFIVLEEEAAGWKPGDRILITASKGEHGNSGTRRPGRTAVPVQTEERIIKNIDGTRLTLDKPLRFEHRGEGPFRAAAANLSRNVIVESAIHSSLAPPGTPLIRGHTMYHRSSLGALSYTEFRRLGKENTLGRYPIHYHLVGNTMRGSYVLGCSIWDSHNRWVVIHGTNHLIVRDCVGYRSVGHGFYLEDGTETHNVLDRNLAVQALVGAKLPRQALPFDPNDGAGFWWANSLNSFTRNSTCENDRYGFRFDATPTPGFRLALPVLFADGKRKVTDVRTLPFIRFEDNEAACDGKYGLNLGEGVNRVGPDHRHPFVLRNTKIWEVRLMFRPDAPSVLIQNMDLHSGAYGVYTPSHDFHVYRNLSISDVGSEPFNRGYDDDSIQHGPVTVDGLFFDRCPGDNPIPYIQISDTNPSGLAETHIRNLKIGNTSDGHTRTIINLGGGNRPDPTSPLCVPVYVHDFFGKGRHAKVISVKSRDLVTDRVLYKELPPLTGDASRVCEVRNLDFPELLDPVDDLPPATVITHVTPLGAGKLRVQGTTIDNFTVAHVLVNGLKATRLDRNFLTWEIELDATSGPLDITAHARDSAGNRETTPHRIVWR